MAKTKERILNVSLALFNEEGLANVTLRKIANYMGISQGNLNYHYKKRVDLIETLYFRFADSVDDKIREIIERDNLNWGYLKVYMSELIGIFYDSRFLFLDFSFVMRVYPNIRDHYTSILQKREQEFPGLFGILSGMKVMKPEEFPGQYLNLYKRIQLLTDFFLSHAEIGNQLDRRKVASNYVQMIATEIYPYLTEEVQESLLQDFHQS